MKETSKNNETIQLGIGVVSVSRFKSAYDQYWDIVKDIIDEEMLSAEFAMERYVYNGA